MENTMVETDFKMALCAAQAASEYERQRTGCTPTAVNAVLINDAVIITLHEVLSNGEKELAKSPSGSARVCEFHRQLFFASCSLLRLEIEAITGQTVLEATSEVGPRTGTVVLVFILAASVPVSVWSEPVSARLIKKTDEISRAERSSLFGAA